ncbi:chaperone NapD [Sphaerotilus mobilis]|uniref:Chaperone NapD n=1 Tax=Sphaerotilus mobilis TaxID=47994 RepID=A0A4Q7LQU2_9BURK|nr:chaperone NapD [Sphaerotilus mobilis]RZS56731.1 periplasmic nitrate reductase chaperone NapD [Sphaerotilus mobilis]
MGLDELHIASLVVHTSPSRVERIAAQIVAMPDAVVHATSERGKLVVTLEASSAPAMSLRVSDIQHIDGVMSAALVYQCADSLDAMNEELPDA